MISRSLLCLTVIGLSCWLAGCASTRFTATWQPENAQLPKSFEKVLVATISPRLSARQTTENELVRMLESLGVQGQASINLLGPDYKFDSTKTEALATELRQKGFDGALVVSVLDVEKSQRYVPGTTYPAGFYGGYGWGYYYPYYGRVYEPGYYTTSTTLFLLTDLFDLESRKLVWTGQTETLDPNQVNSFAREFAKALRDRWRKDNVIAR